MKGPLADLLRPKCLSDVFGQTHLLGKDKVFRSTVETGNIPNMIFYGPPGVGKTTVARIIAEQSGLYLHKLNGTSAGTADIREVIASAGSLAGSRGVLLYLDEIQYLNKKQQQSLLECIENGTLTLIASTTENPYFYVYSALLSRCTVFEFRPLEPADIQRALKRAVSELEKSDNNQYILSDATYELLSCAAGGDVRKALNALDLLSAAIPAVNGVKTITEEHAKQVCEKSSGRYDKADDLHYNLLSALQKSVRGSDPDAAIHYLCRLLDAGDLISPCRRLLVMASEDVGLAYPLAAVITKACVDSALQLGLPEARIPLSEATILLATSPKSNSSYAACGMAMQDIRDGKYSDIPDFLKGTGYSGAESLGHGVGYRYPHDFPNHYVQQQYLPDTLSGVKYYEFGENKNEQAAKAYWDAVKSGTSK